MNLKKTSKNKLHDISELTKEILKDCKMDKTNNKLKIQSNNNTNNKKDKTLGKIIIHLIHRFFAVIYRFILKFIYGRTGEKMPPIKNLLLLESATSLAFKIRTQKFKSVDVIESFIARIKEINPLLNCVVDERYAAALKEAAEVDKLIASGKLTLEEMEQKTPFLGVPITTKDCIMVKDLLQTSGLYYRRNIRSKENADVIELMRNAGAIPLAITNVSECCMWWESYNTVHGRTNNPYDCNRIVGGSSGGEGCLQAAAGSAFGIGSDIGGSIRMPAFFNGIFGHKPSKFIVSNKGQYPIPICQEQNSFLGIGPMCRFATDLKPVLKIISGKNAIKLNLDEPVNLRSINIFYQENDGGGQLVSPVDHDIKIAIDKVIKHFKNTLKLNVTKVNIPRLKKSAAIWFGNMKSEKSIGFDEQLANLDGKINSTWEFVKWIFGQSKHTFVGILTAIAEKTGVQYGTPKYNHLVNERNELLREIRSILGDDGVFIYPVHPTVAPYHTEPIIRALNFSYTGIINVLGLPATACPLGIGSEGLPLGLQVVGNFNQDRLCLAMACEIERAFGGWVAPECTS